jgi:hypothetical protein
VRPLSSLGYRVLATADASAALDVARRDRQAIDLLVTDPGPKRLRPLRNEKRP